MQLTFDQVHLGVPDPVAAADWYRRYLGATPGDHTDRVMFGGTRFIFLKNERPAPSDGAAIDHVALSFSDLDAQMQVLAGSGGRVTAPVSEVAGLYRSGFIEDPWGAKIEVVDDPETIGFHHVHVQVPDPARTRAWYVEMLGGTAGKLKGRLDGVKCADVWLLTQQGTAEPSRGHTVDHIGWRLPDLLTAAATLKARGVTFTTEPQPGPAGDHAPVLLSFAEDPWGVKFELLQRRQPN
jgi:catechol 2,3-dioxygenase-like lactoylglutathione lyase family enzyme